jgi:hypothetical protein
MMWKSDEMEFRKQKTESDVKELACMLFNKGGSIY